MMMTYLERRFRHSMMSDLQIQTPNTENGRGKILVPQEYVINVQNLFQVCSNLQLHTYSSSSLTVKLPVFNSTML